MSDFLFSILKINLQFLSLYLNIIIRLASSTFPPSVSTTTQRLILTAKPVKVLYLRELSLTKLTTTTKPSVGETLRKLGESKHEVDYQPLGRAGCVLVSLELSRETSATFGVSESQERESGCHSVGQL